MTSGTDDIRCFHCSAWSELQPAYFGRRPACLDYSSRRGVGLFLDRATHIRSLDPYEWSFVRVAGQWKPGELLKPLSVF
jgi:hypothetical protein